MFPIINNWPLEVEVAVAVRLRKLLPIINNCPVEVEVEVPVQVEVELALLLNVIIIFSPAERSSLTNRSFVSFILEIPCLCISFPIR